MVALRYAEMYVRTSSPRGCLRRVADKLLKGRRGKFVGEALSTVSIVATIVASSASLGYWLASKFKDIEGRLDRLESRVANLERGLYA